MEGPGPADALPFGVVPVGRCTHCLRTTADPGMLGRMCHAFRGLRAEPWCRGTFQGLAPRRERPTGPGRRV